MHGLQEKEVDQERDLASLLDIEINFVQNYLDILNDIKADWRSACVPITESLSIHLTIG